MWIYLLLFLAGMCEEFVSIIYYKLVQKHYKVLCALVSMIRTFVWAFVISSIISKMEKVVPMIGIYALGGAIGDYISLTIEPWIEKNILKLKRKGRKKKWWWALIEKRT